MGIRAIGRSLVVIGRLVERAQASALREERAHAVVPGPLHRARGAGGEGAGRAGLKKGRARPCGERGGKVKARKYIPPSTGLRTCRGTGVRRYPVMRLTRYKLFLLGGLCLALIGPQLGRTQGPGGGTKMKGGFDTAAWDNRVFDYYAGKDKDGKAKDKIKISEMPTSRMDPDAGKRMEDWAKKKGITSGELTRDQF